MIKVIELGPFGCTLDHEPIQNLDQIPEGYKIKNIITSPDTKTAFIEPDARFGSKSTPKLAPRRGPTFTNNWSPGRV